MHSYVNILIILNVESKYTLVYSKLCRFSKTRLVKRTRSALFKPPTISGKKTKGANSAFQKILFFFSCSQIIFTLLANTFSCKNAICLCLDNGTHCVCGYFRWSITIYGIRTIVPNAFFLCVLKLCSFYPQSLY